MVVKQLSRLVGYGYSIDLYPENILHVIFDGTKKIGVEEAKEIRDRVIEIANGQKFRGIVDFRGTSPGVTTMECRQFMSKNQNFNNLKICDAFVTDSYTTSILIGAYIKLFNPKVPTKTFSDIDKAMNWIEKFNEN